MVKSLVLVSIILTASALILLWTMISPSRQIAENREVAGEPPDKHVTQDATLEALVNNRTGQVPDGGKKAAECGTHVSIPLEKLKAEVVKRQPSVSKTAAAPTAESKTADEDFGSILPNGLPLWFRTLDKDEDGQVALHEWRQAGKSLDEFRKYDLNGDGFITAEEVRRLVKKSTELKLEKGQAKYSGAIEAADEKYRGNKLSKIFTVKFDKGKTYQIDHASKAFDAYLYLEDPDGNVVAENDDGGNGTDSRIVHRAAKTGIYRIIATSLGGTRPGAFSLQIRIVDGPGVLPKGLPSWFKDLDKDGDGQITLHEWRQSGKTVDEFHLYDLNGDGLITVAEALKNAKMPIQLKFQKNQAKSTGTIQATDEGYEGKKLSKTFTINLEKGKTYQIDLMSEQFSAYLYLEDAAGNVVDRIHSGGKGLTARIVHRAADTGTYRLIATSQDGNKTGDFSLAVRVNGK